MDGAASPNSEPFGGVFRGQRVLVTGHTGFKGAWLCAWLLDLGARVAGIGLEAETKPALFGQLGLETRLEHHVQDIRKGDAVADIMGKFGPDFVFHLAAQPLVRLSYEQPVETWETNVLGTIHVLEGLRGLDHPCAAVFITTDKCYENREWIYAYREADPLGGHDPYSSSKAGAEIAVAAWRRSFFPESPVKIASARAGNVIGGGDWALDRIVPDCMRALARGETIPVRNKTSTRPWQHVLEPLGGYLWLGARLAGAGSEGLCEAFNFGPRLESNRTVAELVMEILKHRPGKWEDRSDPNAPHEAGLLNLSIEKAFHALDWSPVWDFEETIARTVKWYAHAGESEDAPLALTRADIADYVAAAMKMGAPWAR
ncbi:MAG: CDP-glucose 4,6-dehydratase [Chthoniobacteraceae bacterium]|jgi:CDP-glucose 4,6-dehydratase